MGKTYGWSCLEKELSITNKLNNQSNENLKY